MLKTFRDYIEASKAIKQNPSTHGYSDEECKQITEFNKTAEQFNSKFNHVFATFDEKLSRALKSFIDSASIIEDKFKDTRSFVNNDWFISFNFIRNFTLKEIINLISNSDKASLDNFVLQRFPQEQKRIFNGILNTIPHRKNIVNEIQTLFENKHYYAVVVLSYTQVDGICNENLRYGFFDTDSKTFDLKIKKLEPNERFASNVAIQLKEPKNEINKYVKKEVASSSYNIESFNRHLVMHGHSYNYGTSLNAIRAILLLDFVCSLVNEQVIRKLH